MKTPAKQQGFTLIELIMVIVLLGVLSAFALPRFADLSDAANDAVVDGFRSSLESGLAIHKAAWYASGTNSDLSDYTAVTTANGVLTGTADDGVAHEVDCRTIWNDLLETTVATVFVSSSNGYASGYSGDIWAQNATNIGALGEATDVYCHYIYITGKSNAPVLRYNIETGVLDEVNWPFSP